MGCFLGCFKGPEDRKRSRKLKKPLVSDKSSHEKETCVLFCPSSSLQEFNSEADVATDNPLPKLRESQEQQGTVVNFKKKVTFNLNVTTFESIPIHEDSIDYSENGEIEGEVKEEKKGKEGHEESTNPLKSVVNPPNHRYQNCENSDDEGLDEEGDNSDDDDDDDEVDFGDDIGLHGDEEESYDSYFSLPMESQRPNFQEVSSPKPPSGSSMETELVIISKGNVRDRSGYIHSVLNPVENLSHWKKVKARPTSLWNLSKENINLDDKTKAFISPDPKSQEAHTPNSSNTNLDDFAKQEITVEASLSNWLVSSDNSRIDPPKSKSFLSISPIRQEERPILGALTLDDIKQSSSRTSSPKKSPSRSPEEIPIVGTVGGYWSSKSKEDSASSWSSGSEKRGIPNTTSKYREDKRVNWYCTPFETRLERALKMESAGTSCSDVESTS